MAILDLIELSSLSVTSSGDGSQHTHGNRPRNNQRGRGDRGGYRGNRDGRGGRGRGGYGQNGGYGQRQVNILFICVMLESQHSGPRSQNFGNRIVTHLLLNNVP